ncbi:unnamed protein product [Paramecium octaurelia]|uniref:Uncharacterized protein n=1 Tax=Paramecium octaurelia TaxID=43137 RepID=A0A8S1SPX8_PAROT|nr:unnamed protein product [Paramecium octaurelia]
MYAETLTDFIITKNYIKQLIVSQKNHSLQNLYKYRISYPDDIQLQLIANLLFSSLHFMIRSERQKVIGFRKTYCLFSNIIELEFVIMLIQILEKHELEIYLIYLCNLILQLGVNTYFN